MEAIKPNKWLFSNPIVVGSALNGVHGAVSCIVDLHEYEQSIDMIHQGEDLRRTFGAGQEKTDKITYV